MSLDKNYDYSHIKQYSRVYKPLTEADILLAQEHARSAAETARILGVSYATYKKYAKIYGLFDRLKNRSGIGIPKSPRGIISLDEILEGKHPEYNIFQLKKRLLFKGLFLERCSNCGFDEKRLTDDKVPLIMDFLDGDRKNHKKENIRFLCFNCYFLLVGNISGPKKNYIY